MKDNYKDLLVISFCFLILCFGIINNNELCLAVSKGFNLWLTKTFPSLFPSVLITNILLDYNIEYYVIKLVKNIKFYLIFFSILCGSINGVILIKNLFSKNIINQKEANYALIFSFYPSIVFLIAMLTLSFSFKYAILLISISYVSNIMISIPFKINNDIKISKNHSHNTMAVINKTLNILFVILGIGCLFILISSLISNLIGYNSIFIDGVLELSQGLFYLNNVNTDLWKSILAIFFISFGGLSIHLQVKSILADTSISYKYFFIGRILNSIISIGIFLIIYTFCI